MGKQAPNIAEDFEHAVDQARSSCEDGNFRQAAWTLEKLAVTLHTAATGRDFADMARDEEDFVPGFVISGKDEEG